MYYIQWGTQLSFRIRSKERVLLRAHEWYRCIQNACYQLKRYAVEVSSDYAGIKTR